MNKKALIIGAVVIVLIVIFGVILWDKKTVQAPTVPVSTSTAPAQSASSSTSTASSTSPISVSIVGTYTGKSFSLIYPTSWSIVSITPFSLDTFKGTYGSGGVIPAGGAEIDIATTTTAGSVQDIIKTELMSATNLTASKVTVDKVSCDKEVYQANYASGHTSSDISVYCSRGNELWKIYFSYNANDPAEKTHVADFNEVLGSLKFLP